MRIERIGAEDAERLGGPGAVAAHLRSLVPDPESVDAAVREIIAGVRADGDRAVLDYTRRLDTAGADPKPLARGAGGARRGAHRPGARPGRRTAGGDRQRRRGRPGGRQRERRRRPCPGPARHAARGASGLGCGLRARRAGAVSEHRRDGRRHRARRRRARRRGVRAAGRRRRDRHGDTRHVPAVRRRAGLQDGRRPGDRRAGLRHRDDPARRRHRRSGKPLRAGGQAAALGRRRDRRVRRPERPAGRARRGRLRARGAHSRRWTCSRRQSTERAASSWRCRRARA